MTRHKLLPRRGLKTRTTESSSCWFLFWTSQWTHLIAWLCLKMLGDDQRQEKLEGKALPQMGFIFVSGRFGFVEMLLQVSWHQKGNLFSLIVFQANTETVWRSQTGRSKDTSGLIVRASPTCEAHLWFKHTLLCLNPFAPKTWIYFLRQLFSLKKKKAKQFSVNKINYLVFSLNISRMCFCRCDLH